MEAPCAKFHLPCILSANRSIQFPETLLALNFGFSFPTLGTNNLGISKHLLIVTVDI